MTNLHMGSENVSIKRSLSMLGWAFNEEENIGEYIERAEKFLRQAVDDFELIIIDDGSTDHTWEIASDYQKTRPWLRLYRNDRNRGSGYNTKLAISLAQKDYLFWQTVDWSYDITVLGESFHLLDTYDVLQGVRLQTISPQGMLWSRSDNPIKAIISVVNYTLIRFLFGLPLRDYQNVTVYPTRLIQSVPLESESAFTNPECLLKTWWKGATIKEIPVPFIRRSKGVAKGTRIKYVISSIEDVIYWWFRWVVVGKRKDKKEGKVISYDQS